MDRIPADHEGLQRYAKAVLEQETRARDDLARHTEIWGDGPPYFSVATHEFWRDLAQDKFHLARCGSCDHVYFPPRVVCPECWAQDAGTLQETPGVGTLAASPTSMSPLQY